MLLTFLRRICFVVSHHIPLCKIGICTPSQSYLHLASMMYTWHASLYFLWLLHMQVDEYSSFLVEKKISGRLCFTEFHPKNYLSDFLLLISLLNITFLSSLHFSFVLFVCLKTLLLLLFKNE